MRAEWDTCAEAAVDRVCEKCGKTFIPAPYHQFVAYGNRDHDGNQKKKYFCCWSCFNHRNDTPHKRGARPRKVMMYDKSGEVLLGEFDNAQEAALKLTGMGYSADNRKVQQVCRGELLSHCGFVFKYKE